MPILSKMLYSSPDDSSSIGTTLCIALCSLNIPSGLPEVAWDPFQNLITLRLQCGSSPPTCYMSTCTSRTFDTLLSDFLQWCLFQLEELQTYICYRRRFRPSWSVVIHCWQDAFTSHSQWRQGIISQGASFECGPACSIRSHILAYIS